MHHAVPSLLYLPKATSNAPARAQVCSIVKRPTYRVRALRAYPLYYVFAHYNEREKEAPGPKERGDEEERPRATEGSNGGDKKGKRIDERRGEAVAEGSSGIVRLPRYALAFVRFRASLDSSNAADRVQEDR